jgi:hypothetical protein
MIPAGARLISSHSCFLYCGDPHPADGSLKPFQKVATNTRCGLQISRNGLSPLALGPHRCSGGWELDRRLRPSHVGLICPESLKVGCSQL